MGMGMGMGMGSTTGHPARAGGRAGGERAGRGMAMLMVEEPCLYLQMALWMSLACTRWALKQRASHPPHGQAPPLHRGCAGAGMGMGMGMGSILPLESHGAGAVRPLCDP